MTRKKSKPATGAKGKKRPKKALGRGLDALIPGMEPGADGTESYFQCDIELIRPNRYQPRIRFPADELAELSRSIEEQGIIQPLLVRSLESGYELIAGERRLRASKMAGLKQVPVVVMSVDESAALEVSIVENIQREDLNPIEEADAYHRLIEEFSLTQDQAAARIGKSRSAVANLIRLRQLPEEIKESIVDGRLSMGHARAILGADGRTRQHMAWRMVLSKSLSVRETEALIKRLNSEKQMPRAPIAGSTDRHLSDVADELSRRFGTKVAIKRRGQRGKVEIDFYSNDDLDRLIQLLKQL